MHLSCKLFILVKFYPINPKLRDYVVSEGEYTHMQTHTHRCHSFTKSCDFMSQRLKIEIDKNNKHL